MDAVSSCHGDLKHTQKVGSLSSFMTKSATSSSAVSFKSRNKYPEAQEIYLGLIHLTKTVAHKEVTFHSNFFFVLLVVVLGNFFSFSVFFLLEFCWQNNLLNQFIEIKSQNLLLCRNLAIF